MALKEKCRKMASCAKIIPPIGELKPAEMAAATQRRGSRQTLAQLVPTR